MRLAVAMLHIVHVLLKDRGFFVSLLQSEKNELEKYLRSLQVSNTQLTAIFSELGLQLEAEKQKIRDLSAILAQYDALPLPGASEMEL